MIGANTFAPSEIKSKHATDVTIYGSGLQDTDAYALIAWASVCKGQALPSADGIQLGTAQVIQQGNATVINVQADQEGDYRWCVKFTGQMEYQVVRGGRFHVEAGDGE